MLPLRFLLAAVTALASSAALADDAAVTPAAYAGDARVLLYPEAGPDPVAAPLLRVHRDGMPVSLFFPDRRLDPRAPVHHLSDSRRFGLRIAERTAWLYAVQGAGVEAEAVATLTLESGRPLPFRIRVVPDGVPADVTVQVRLPADAGAVAPVCEAAVQRVRDDLAECREGERRRQVQSSARRLAEVPSAQLLLGRRGVRRRAKQNRMWVEVTEMARVFDHLYLRLKVDNRDDAPAPWRLGEAAVVVTGDGEPHRIPVVAVAHPEVIGTGERASVVLAVTADLPEAARLEVVLPEAGGERHVVIEDLPAGVAR